MKSRLLWGAVAACVAGSLYLAGCEKAGDKYGPQPECSSDNCDSNIGAKGGSVGSGGAGGGTTTGPTTNITGTVVRLSSPDFTTTLGTSYTGDATILGPGASGATVTATYPTSSPLAGTGGGTSDSFTLSGVVTGNQWLEVRDDTSGGAGVMTTFSQADITSSLGQITLPLVDLGMLQNIASNLPSVATNGVSTIASQIVLFIGKNDVPLKGVHVTSGAVGGIPVYDLGSGIYSDSATSTGEAGTIIIFNSGASGSATIVVTDTATNNSFQVVVPVSPGAITLGAFGIVE